MIEDNDALEFETLAATLKMEQRQAKDLVETFATMLESSLPGHTAVSRGGWLLSKEKPVQDLLVKFDEFHYQITREKSGTYTAKQLKIVRGIALKTSELQLEQCLKEILKELSTMASKNAQAREALSKFVSGF